MANMQTENKGRKVLVIDDSDIIRDIATQHLEAAGYVVREACNGLDGLFLIKNEPFDIIITDIIMPEKEGIETLVEVRDMFPAMPIIAMSGVNDVYLKVALKLGANAVLKKPFSGAELLQAVDRAFGTKGVQ